MSGFLSWIQSAIYNLVVPLLPNSLQELVLFVVTVILVIIIIDLFVYTNIQRRIKNDSRCYQENKNNERSVPYTTTVTFNGKPLFTITFNKITGDTTTDDVCRSALTQGAAFQTFKIPYYRNNNGTANLIEKEIVCPSVYNVDITNLRFTGNNPDFNRFTQFGGSTSFFNAV